MSGRRAAQSVNLAALLGDCRVSDKGFHDRKRKNAEKTRHFRRKEPAKKTTLDAPANVSIFGAQW